MTWEMKRWTLVLAIPLAVLVCSGVACALLLDAESHDTRRARIAAARDAAATFQERLETTVSRLNTTAGLFVASEEVTAAEFRKFTSTLVRDPTISTIAYIDRVPAAERAAFERELGVPIVDGGGSRAKRAPPRREYFPYALWGTKPEEPRVNTPDAAGEPVRAAALRRARDTGAAQTTGPIRTFTDRLRALLVFVPVYDSALPPDTLAERRRTLRGYAAGILPLDQLVPRSQVGSVTLVDRGRRIAGAPALPDPTAVSVLLAGRAFRLRVDTAIDPDRVLAVALGVGGLLLAALTGTVLVMLLRRDAYAQQLVKQRLAEQRKAEAALEESERRHRLLAEHASDWITLIDAYGMCTYSSPSVRQILGREPSDVVGRFFTELLHPDDLNAASRVLKEIAHGEDPPSVELRQRHAEGYWVPTEATLSVIRDDETREVVEVRCASRDVTERQRLEEELRRLAVEDTLTGLPNRRGLAERLETELAMSRRYSGGALLLIDLDEFKQVNDTLGHSAGDRVLCRVADVLRERMRESDYIARLGGDEFAAVLPRVDGPRAKAAADGILDALREDAELRRLFGHRVTASVGIALMSDDPSLSAETLLGNADQAMYDAKHAGRNRASVSQPEDVETPA
jgi:diguanylate cyclase (GGDEF)-like protein/PAS domain S-box-containing protein